MIAKTAPMGWNSWNCYGASVTEDIVRKNAEFMARRFNTLQLCCATSLMPRQLAAGYLTS